MTMTRFAAVGALITVMVVSMGSNCAPGNVDLTGGCPSSVSGLAWSINVSGGTPIAFSTEMRVGQSVTMGASTFSIGCTIPSYSVSWRHSNPAVAMLTAGTPQPKSATLAGIAPGSTVITAEILGDDGARASATTEMRIVP